jgi:GTPase SAR1 family protein
MIEALTGAGGKLAAMGLGRGIGLLFSKFVRVWRIDQSVRGVDVDPTVRIAISDYETYISATHGQYTVVVEAFHRELMRSGLADAMMELAIVDRQSTTTEEAFHNIYERFFPEQSRESALDLYKVIYTSFRASVRGLVGNDALVRFLHSFQKQINSRLDQIDSSSSEPIGITSTDSLFQTVHAITKGLLAHYKTLKVETLNGAREVNIADIYVSPSLRLTSQQKRVSELASIMPAPMERIQRGTRHVDVATAGVRGLLDFSYSELRSSFRRIVILGDPGGGKSTLCQRLCYDMAKASSLALQYQGKNHVAIEDQKIPFRIILRLFEQARVTEPQLDLLTYLIRDLRHHASADEKELRTACNYLLQTGRAVIAFDGLDEILETARRREYVEIVTAFCNKYPLCPTLVTSRLVGYENAPLPSDFDKVQLKRFEKSEILEYAEKFLTQIGDATKSNAESEAQRFVSQTEDNAADLRRNPLMLGLMLWLFMAKGDVPSNRPAIYSECSTLMFDKWDGNRGIKSAIPSGFDRLQLFSNLSSKIYPYITLRAGVSRQWLTDTLNDYFKDKFVDGAKAYESAESLVNFIVGRAWVMMESGEGIFAFTHQTFMEYFFAKHLESRHDSVKSLFKEIRPKIIKRELDVVNHLALQTKCAGNDRLQSIAIDEILKYADSLSSPPSVQAVMIFAAKALEYLAPSEGDVRRLVAALVVWSIEQHPTKNSDFGLIHAAIASCNLRRSFVASEVTRLLSTYIASSNEAHARASATFMRPSGRGVAISRGFELSDTGRHLAEKSKKELQKRAGDDAWWAQHYWGLFGEVTESSLEKFGLEALINCEVTFGFDGIYSLDNFALCSTSTYAVNIGNGLANQKVIRNSLSAIGKYGFANFKAGDSISASSRYIRMGIPPQVWISVFSSLLEERDLFLGALFVLSVDNIRNAGRGVINGGALNSKKLLSIFKEFERNNRGWARMTPSVLSALKLENEWADIIEHL